MKRRLDFCIAMASLLAASVAFASFHTFRIEQIYSNADGTVQFVVMHESMNVNGENLWAGQTLTSTHPGGVPKVYQFPNNLPAGASGGDDGYGYGYYPMPSPTANKRVLIATQGFAALGIVTPDFVISNGFLPTDGGTVNYAGVDSVTYSSLPTDGVKAIDRNGAIIQNLATNFAGTTGSVSPPPTALNFQGLWYKAPAESESGWGINFAHQGDVIFVTWFTYDLTGKAWWLTMTATKTAANTYTGDLLETRGPAFNAVPFVPSAVTRHGVGSGTLTFSDANNGSFAYTVNGVAQTKAITRQVFGVLPVCTFGTQPNLTLATNYQDLWYAAPAESESGWGVNFTHQGDTIFATWFTYDLDGTPLWLSVTATKTGPGVYTGTLVRTTGPAFSAVPFDPMAVGRNSVGSLTITFANGNSAAYAYTATVGTPSVTVTQTKTITRQVFVAPGTGCH